MGYAVALNKAWQDLEKIAENKKFRVKFLADEYEIDLDAHRTLSLACNVLAKEHITILILHYLIQKLKGLPQPEGDWVPFKEFPGGEGYYAAFRKRAIEPIIRKYGRNPSGLLSCLDRLAAKKIQYGDCAVVLDVFIGVPVLITIFGEDKEFSAEANMLFDRTVSRIFCSEDIAVLAGFVASVV